MISEKERKVFQNLLNKNNRRFTVIDTPLSHRQINTLGVDKLIPDSRLGKSGWRKFNFIELTYICIINELKKFGVTHNQIHSFNQAYLAIFGRWAIVNVLNGNEIILAITSDGQSTLFVPSAYILSMPNIPFIQIQLNKIINDQLQKLNIKPVPVKYSVRDIFLEGADALTVKEKAIFKYLRNKDYIAVRITKKDGNSYVLHARKYNDSKGGVTIKEVAEIIKGNDYQNVSIVKRDGKIVVCDVEEIVKM